MRDRSELTLRKQKDFARVYKSGESKGSRFVVVLYKRNGLGYTRTAFVSSKKVGNAVTRNRARRLMREAYRAFGHQVKEGYDIIYVARNTISGHNEKEVEKNMRSATAGCGLLDKNQTR